MQDKTKKICILKFPCGRTDLEVMNAFLKQNHRYLKVECYLPSHCRSDQSPGATKSIFFGGFGIKPKKPSYFSRAFHAEKVLLVAEISEIFYLQPLFESKEEQEEESISGAESMKIEKKDELEHRKKNINYLLKMYKKEDFKCLKYFISDFLCLPENLEAFSSKEAKLNFPDSNKEAKRLKKIIFNARIVNLSELKKISSYENIPNILDELTIAFRGRFILKNEFYEKELQITRKSILENLNSDDSISMPKVLLLERNKMFLLEELFAKIDGKYILKGYKEDLGIKDGNFDVLDNKKKVLKSFLEHKICSLKRIVEESKLKKPEVEEILRDSCFLKLSNNCYAKVPELEDSFASHLLNIFSGKHSIKKSEVQKLLKQDSNKKSSFEEALSVLESFCHQKGASWILKYDDFNAS